MKRILISLLAFIIVACTVLGLVACGEDATEIKIGENGNWFINGEDTGVSAKGEDGKDSDTTVVGIQKVETNDEGNLVITYTNGETATIEMPKGSDTCAHETLTLRASYADNCWHEGYEFKSCADCDLTFYATLAIDETHEKYAVENAVIAPTCTEEGFTAEIGCLCGKYAVNKYDFEDALEHGYDEITTEATCFVDGYVTYICTNECVVTDAIDYDNDGEIDYLVYDECADSYVEGVDLHPELTSLGHHGEFDWVYIAEEGVDPCTDNWTMAYMCLDCYENDNRACLSCKDAIEETEVQEPVGHDYANTWIITAVPTEDTVGAAEGYCNICGFASIELPVLSADDYDIAVQTSATCATTGISNYTLKNTSGKVKCEIITTAQHQSVAGTYVDNDELQNIDLPGMTVLGNKAPTCTENGMGSYKCVVCSNTYVVDIKASHTAETVAANIPEGVVTGVTLVPTCYRNGEGTDYCKVCKKTYTYEITSTVTHSMVAAEPVEDGSVWKISIACKNEGCTEGDTVVSYMQPTEAGSLDPTCKSDGYVKYNVKLSATAAVTEVEFVIPAIGHNFNGYALNGTFTYKDLCTIFGTAPNTETEDPDDFIIVGEGDADEGFTWAGGATAKPTACNKYGTILVYCNDDDCSSTDPVQLAVTATAVDHQLKEVEKVSATCKTEGHTEYVCTVCNLPVIKDIVPAGQHVWSLAKSANIKPIKDIDDSIYYTGTLVLECNGCGEISKPNVVGRIYLVTEPATCVAQGRVYYSYNAQIDDDVIPETKTTEILPIDNTAHAHWDTVNEEYIEVSTSKKWVIGDLNAIFGAGNVTVIGGTEGFNCTTPRMATVKCDRCSTAQNAEVSVVIDAVIGNHIPGEDVIPATCTENAKNQCTKCNAFIDAVPPVGEEADYAAQGHKVEVVVTAKPTTTKKGVATATCKVCGVSEDITLPKLPKSDYVVTDWTLDNYNNYNPTCTATGYKVYYMSVEAETLEEWVTVKVSVVIPANGHDFSDEVVTWVGADGKTHTGYICEDCGEIVEK